MSSVSEQRESGTANDLETAFSGPKQAARRELSTAAARRIALAAQGFAWPRPQKPAGGGQIRELIGQLGLLQLDSVTSSAAPITCPSSPGSGPTIAPRLT